MSFFDSLQQRLDAGVDSAREAPALSSAALVVAVAVFLNGLGFSLAVTVFFVKTCAARLCRRRKKGERVRLRDGDVFVEDPAEKIDPAAEPGSTEAETLDQE